MIEAVFVDFSCRKLRQMAGRVTTCLDVLTEEQLWQRPNPHSNAVGNLVLHLAGNVRQWVIAGVGGATDARERAAEFAAESGTRDELKRRLTETIDQACAILQSLPAERLSDQVEIQGFRLTILEGIYHVVEHFSGHTGQIILLAKTYAARPFDFYNYLDEQHPDETP